MSAGLTADAVTDRHDRHGAAVRNMNIMLGLEETNHRTRRREVHVTAFPLIAKTAFIPLSLLFPLETVPRFPAEVKIADSPKGEI